VSGVKGKLGQGNSGGSPDVAYWSKTDWDKLLIAKKRKRIQSLCNKSKSNKKAKVDKKGGATCKKLAELAAATI
jgi:hypothetical protein